MKYKIKEWFSKIKEFIKNLTPKQKMYISIGLVLGFILVNSMLNGAISMWLSALPKKIVQFFIPHGKIKWLDLFLIYGVRKFAHFIEYMVLGLLVSKYYYSNKRTLQKLINSVYIIISLALVDETIQIFSGRESLVSDIWLDLSGGIVGIFVYMFIKFLNHNKNRRRK